MKIIDTLKSKAKKLKKMVTAVYYASGDTRLPLLPKIIAAVTVLYALSPIDLIPDFIPVLGYLDDLIILPALIGLAVKLIPKEVMDDAEKKADEQPIQLRKNWTFGVLFILLWAAVIYAVVSKIIL